MKNKMFFVTVALWLPIMVLAHSDVYNEGHKKAEQGNYEGAIGDFNHAFAL